MKQLFSTKYVLIRRCVCQYSYKSILLLVILFFSTQLAGQGKKEMPNIKELHEKKWEYIVKHLNTKNQELRDVKPLFLEFENAMWKFHKQSRELRRNARNKKMTNDEYKILNDQLINIEIKRTHHLRKYHMKLRAILAPKTLYEYYDADRRFQRELLHNRPNRKRNRK